MDSSPDFKTLRDSIQTALVAATRTVNGLANEDLPFQRTVNSSVANRLDETSDRFLKLASGLLKSAGNATGQRVSALDDADDVDIQWKSIVDVIDGLLEKADTCLDDYTSLIKRKDAPTSELARDPKRLKSTSDRLDWSMKRANILKPQDSFEKKVDNFDTGPWKPLLTRKPHATVALEDSLVLLPDGENDAQYRNPYETEILNVQYPQQVYEQREPKMYLPVESTSAIWVDTYEGVLEMLEELKRATEIAVDLEHHDWRTYQGLLSLMQISTREKDWIVDTLVPWRHKLEILNEVFADPKIVKVLHGAYMDVMWLQRDLGLYVVGLFDTFHASDILSYQGKSLAFLLKKFVDFDADKKYQMADWRLRPLPNEMFYYARSDTHYLLYIYDMVCNELLERSDRNDPEKDFIELVVQKSKEVALQRYENPTYDPESGQGPRGWYNALVKSSTLYDSRQFAVYKAVYKWRDAMARRKDESTFFLMTQQVLADIARVTPTDKKALWSLLDGNARVLRGHLDELFDIIQTALVEGANGPRMMDIFQRSSTIVGQKESAGNQPKPAVEANGNTPDIKELKSQRSQFWGDLLLSSVWEEAGKPAATDDERVEILLSYPQLVEGEDEDGDFAAPTEARQAEEVEAPADEEFTLKKSGRKRKVDDREAESASDADSNSGSQMELDQAAEPESADVSEFVSVDASGESGNGNGNGNGNEAARLSKKERKKKRAAVKRAKKEKKAAREQEKATTQAAGDGEEGDEEEEGGEVEEDDKPFDYGKAESLLHAPKTANGGKNGGKGKKAFDPYSKKTGDAPKGARMLGLVKSGRSATFKK